MSSEVPTELCCACLDNLAKASKYMEQAADAPVIVKIQKYTFQHFNEIFFNAWEVIYVAF